MTRSTDDTEGQSGTWRAALKDVADTSPDRASGRRVWRADDQFTDLRPPLTREDVAFHAKEVFASHGCVPGQDDVNWLDAEGTLRSDDDLALHA